MKRFFALIVTGILFIALTSFLRVFQSDVTITMDMPDVIEAGTEITVNVTINKGRLSGFAQFRQELPVGFTATSMYSANADFSFRDQTVRLVWLRMPDTDEINLSYRIIANERLTGSIDLNGQFTWIDNNERMSTHMQPQMLAINASPNVPIDRRIDVNEYAKVASIEAAAAGTGQTVALRQQPTWMEGDRVFLVTLLINRDAAQRYAKIEYTVPDGFTAAVVDSRGGIFNFRNQTAQIIWQNLPADPFFTVTYMLIPQEGVTVNPAAAINITGEFTYMISDRTFTSGTVQRRETLAGMNREQLNNILRNLDLQVAEQPALIAATTPPRTPPPVYTNSPRTTTTPTAQTATRRLSQANIAHVLPFESGIRYRVQIAAGQREVNIQQYFRRFRLEHTVMLEEHEGWLKYSVGSFTEYSDARDLRVHLRNTTTIDDAFVAAYNDSRRITVQEALMASNQRWVR